MTDKKNCEGCIGLDMTEEERKLNCKGCLWEAGWDPDDEELENEED